jgi:hypothetical protein
MTYESEKLEQTRAKPGVSDALILKKLKNEITNWTLLGSGTTAL